MPIPRNQLISLDATPHYYVVVRWIPGDAGARIPSCHPGALGVIEVSR